MLCAATGFKFVVTSPVTYLHHVSFRKLIRLLTIANRPSELIITTDHNKELNGLGSLQMMTFTKEMMQLDITLHCCTIETCNNKIAIHSCMASAWVSC